MVSEIKHVIIAEQHLLHSHVLQDAHKPDCGKVQLLLKDSSSLILELSLNLKFQICVYLITVRSFPVWKLELSCEYSELQGRVSPAVSVISTWAYLDTDSSKDISSEQYLQ